MNKSQKQVERKKTDSKEYMWCDRNGVVISLWVQRGEGNREQGWE